ncbi:MAG: hypothetical protein ACRC50_02995, partial [Gaiella sp.]
ARTAALRGRARKVDELLAGLPTERDAASAARESALADQRAAGEALAALEERIASFGRRTGQDERDQAQRELVRAHEAVHDTAVRLDRAIARIGELDDLGRALRAEAEGLVVEAQTLAEQIRAQPRVAEAGKGEPGAALVSLEDWGARARAALFVARGPLASERERIVNEANQLGSTVLGEPLGASSASVVRRRIGEALGVDLGSTGG